LLKNQFVNITGRELRMGITKNISSVSCAKKRNGEQPVHSDEIKKMIYE